MRQITTGAGRHSSIMPLEISEGLKQEVTFYLQRGDTNRMIHDATQIDKIHIRKLRRNFMTTGNVVPPSPPPGRPKKLGPEHEQVGQETGTRAIKIPIELTLYPQALLRFLTRKPNAYHEEIAEFVADAFDVKVHQSSISRALKKLGIVRLHRKRPVPGEPEKNGEDGMGQLLRGPGPRPSMLVDVRNLDPALQYSMPPAAPRLPDLQHQLGNSEGSIPARAQENPHPPQILSSSENQRPQQAQEAFDSPRTSEHRLNSNATMGINGNSTRDLQ